MTDRLRTFVRSHMLGKCRVLSRGADCDCLLCEIDRLDSKAGERDALRANEQLALERLHTPSQVAALPSVNVVEIYTANPCRITLSYQDDGRTLKVFVERERDNVLGAGAVHTLCIQCGPNVSVDADGCCLACGCDARPEPTALVAIREALCGPALTAIEQEREAVLRALTPRPTEDR